jgi:hypothetical protein
LIFPSLQGRKLLLIFPKALIKKFLVAASPAANDENGFSAIVTLCAMLYAQCDFVTNAYFSRHKTGVRKIQKERR